MLLKSVVWEFSKLVSTKAVEESGSTLLRFVYERLGIRWRGLRSVHLMHTGKCSDERPINFIV